MMISAALVLAMGCGKKETGQPQGQAKAPSKTAVPDSKNNQPKSIPKKVSPRAEPKMAGQKPGTVLWEFETGDRAGGPSIGNDGTVYVGSFDKNIYALNSGNGAKKWEFETGGWVNSSPAIGPDNTVYACSRDNKIYALDGKTGTKKWEFKTGARDNLYSSPALGLDGTVYVGSMGGKVYALNGKSGAKKWEFGIRGTTFASPVVGLDNKVYAASVNPLGGGVLYALDGKTGSKIWEHKVKDNQIANVPAIGSDSIVYFGISLDAQGDKGKMIALEGKDGTVNWEFSLNANGHPSLSVIGADKNIYFGTQMGNGDSLFYSVDGKSGLKKWEHKIQRTGLFPPSVMASPAMGDDGTVYIGANTDRKGELLALNGKSGVKKWALEIGAINGIVIGADGIIYVGSAEGKVYAIKTSSKGPAKSPWPMRGQNPQNTGRAPAK
ncbi:MAG: PQQ-binding-like beta-propeller repeat protein [Verrucomicrobiota bacterium]|jgi:outer membrane protein assembly factor BamB|nr:PQQ-binding-like beta-propeller repeat protein [Verrucomicrobiota bacterium]